MEAEIRLWKSNGKWQWTMCQENAEGYEVVAKGHDFATLDDAVDSFPDFDTLPAVFK